MVETQAPNLGSTAPCKVYGYGQGDKICILNSTGLKVKFWKGRVCNGV